MPTNVSYNGTTYPIPLAGELNWTTLSAFLIDVGQTAGLTTIAKQAIRTAVTSPVTVSASADYTIVTNLTTPGAVAVNLPAGVNGQVFIIVDGKGDAGTNAVTITPNGAETINGAASLVMSQNRQTYVLQYSTTGTNWNVLGSYYVPLANPLTTTGDIIYSSGGNTPARLGIGAAGTVLKGGTTPSYSQVATADIASLAVTDAKVASGITGVKILPDFGTQNVTTTGSVRGDRLVSGSVSPTASVLDVRNTTSSPSVSTDALAYFATGLAAAGNAWAGIFENSSTAAGRGGLWVDVAKSTNDTYALRVTTNSNGTDALSVLADNSVAMAGTLSVTGGITVAGGSSLSTYVTGTVSVNWMHGAAAFQTRNIVYTRIGNQVTLFMDTLSAAASANNAPLTLNASTLLPSIVRPISDIVVPIIIRNAGSIQLGMGRIDVSTAGQLSIYTTTNGANFTASGGTIGTLSNPNITYLVV